MRTYKIMEVQKSNLSAFAVHPSAPILASGLGCICMSIVYICVYLLVYIVCCIYLHEYIVSKYVCYIMLLLFDICVLFSHLWFKCICCIIV